MLSSYFLLRASRCCTDSDIAAALLAESELARKTEDGLTSSFIIGTSNDSISLATSKLKVLTEMIHKIHPSAPYNIEAEWISDTELAVAVTSFPMAEIRAFDNKEAKIIILQDLLRIFLDDYTDAYGDECNFCSYQDGLHEIDCPVWRARVHTKSSLDSAEELSNT